MGWPRMVMKSKEKQSRTRTHDDSLGCGDMNLTGALACKESDSSKRDFFPQ